MSRLERAEAERLDAADPLRGLRERFHIPPSPGHRDGRPAVYLCGNSLGLQPKGVAPALQQELDDWARLGVEGHFHARHPWYSYHEPLRPLVAPLVGAHEDEVAVMNSLSVNLHLLLVSFFRPAGRRRRLLIDEPCFPSDRYAAQSQLRLHGLDPRQDLLAVGPRPGEDLLRTEDLLDLLERQGQEVAVVLLGGVNYLSGQRLDVPRVAAAARAQGCLLGLDLAHAAGNVPLELHAWGVDFAVWCSYKYLNAGPGALGGAFVHRRHLGQGGPAEFAAFAARPRLEGWWGNDPAARFAMSPEFVPVPRVDAWQLSNPPIFSLTPVRVSLELFAEATLPALRRKSLALTGYLERLLREVAPEVEVLTPSDPEARGCQLSLRLRGRAERVSAGLKAAGVVCDLRRPDVIRVAPAPLYNSFADCLAFAEALAEALPRA